MIFAWLYNTALKKFMLRELPWWSFIELKKESSMKGHIFGQILKSYYKDAFF